MKHGIENDANIVFMTQRNTLGFLLPHGNRHHVEIQDIVGHSWCGRPQQWVPSFCRKRLERPPPPPPPPNAEVEMHNLSTVPNESLKMQKEGQQGTSHYTRVGNASNQKQQNLAELLRDPFPEFFFSSIKSPAGRQTFLWTFQYSICWTLLRE